MELTQAISEAISRATGQPFRASSRQGTGGGCINATEVLEDHGRRFFVKVNEARRLDMFEAETAGLEEIRASDSVRVPEPVARGTAAGQAFLVLEYLDLGGGNRSSESRLGHQLAAMHRHTQSHYGWRLDNTIGSTPQINTAEQDWITFYREHRLCYQMELAAGQGGGQLLTRGEPLLERLPEFFRTYQPVASLLHGDLWGGNHGALRDGTPVIFDPAVYYGDREADLAMTELFGGFGSDFYAAYNDAWPLDDGYRTRKHLYNLYHVLNHFNLFGGGYASQAERLIQQLLSDVR